MSPAARRAARMLLVSQPVYWFGLIMTSATTLGMLMLGARAGMPPIFVGPLWLLLVLQWPAAMTCNVLNFRQLLMLPLSAADIGAVYGILRVVLPACCLLAVALVWLAARNLAGHPPQHPDRFLGFVIACCSAFPAMVLLPFSPISVVRAEASGLPRGCGTPTMRRLAVASIVVVAPAVALLPWLVPQSAAMQAVWLSVSVGAMFAAVAWHKRASLVNAVFRNVPGGVQSLRGTWRGWSGLVPVLGWRLLVLLAVAPMVVLIFLFQQRIAVGRDFSMLETGYVLAAVSQVFMIWAVDARRALRLLPVPPTQLAAVVLLSIVTPWIPAFLLVRLMAAALHLRPYMSLDRCMLLCGASICFAALCIPVTLRYGRYTLGTLVSFGLLALQWALMWALIRWDVTVPSNTWMALLTAGLLIILFGTLCRSIVYGAMRSPA